ncbi:Nif11-like leader peptide family natural product precursor [Kitasatospora sp. NPDC058965]|uniref:Nif11-like leader peptide family natural product precursor n=1 Tax=Kitasatospora sp. NPDC058965 TaxID=3346682 RepID=UPI0036814BD2
MSEQNVIEFLTLLADRQELLEKLRVLGKSEVLAAAAELGLPFTDEDFDPLVWGLEIKLAEHRGEVFDNTFPLWATMWGRHYLDYLVEDVVPSLRQTGLLA